MRVAIRANTSRQLLLRVTPLLIGATVPACVYFNALYNANRLFDRGESAIESGDTSTGKSILAQSIEKAERILRDDPDSRWADDAARLLTRSHLLREEWEAAAESGRRLLSLVHSHADSAEAAGYLGMAELQLGQPRLADSLLTEALGVVKDRDRRAELSYDRARARRQLNRVDEADADLRMASKLKPEWAAPRLERVKLLVQAGRGDEASTEFASIMSRSYVGVVEQTILETAHEAVATNPAAGVQLLNGVEDSGLLRANRAELVQLRGTLALAVGDTARALADFSLARDLAPDSPAAVDAYLAEARIGLRQAAGLDDLEAVRSTLTRALTNPSGSSLGIVRELLEISRRVAFWVGQGGLGYIAAAEAARDQLGAPLLARNLFLKYVDSDPEALWAAKAILAAIELTPVDSAADASDRGRDSDGAGGSDDAAARPPTAAELRARLMRDYRHSAYVEVLLGGSESQFTYEELESGLRAQLERLEVLADQQLRRGRPGTGGGRREQ